MGIERREHIEPMARSRRENYTSQGAALRRSARAVMSRTTPMLADANKRTRMVFMNWESRFELGVAAMDAEHKGLIAAMNDVHDLDAKGASKPTIDAAITKLATLTKQHFADEEKHMESIGFPDRRTHAIIHAGLLEKFGALHTSFKTGDGKVDRAFFDFLSFWLRGHIMGIDRKYAAHGKPVRV